MNSSPQKTSSESTPSDEQRRNGLKGLAKGENSNPKIDPDDSANSVCPFCGKEIVAGKIWLHAESNTVKVQGYLYWCAGEDVPDERWKVENKFTLLKADGFINAYPARKAYQCRECRSVTILFSEAVSSLCNTCNGTGKIQAKGILWGKKIKMCQDCKGTCR